SIIKSHNCSHVIAKATSAMRLASNSQDIISMVHDKYGIDIKVISGDEEARLSFLGATSAVEAEKYVVIDVGGGSTEIVYGDRNNILFSKSFLGGVVSFTENCVKHDPPLREDTEELNRAIHERFLELKSKFPKGFSVVAVAGTPTSLSCVKQHLQHYDEDKVENSVLTLEDINRLAEEFSKVPSKEILEQYPEIMKGREDVIYSGTLILKNILELLPAEGLIVSGRGIRYGAVIDFQKNL
ncbi:MAG: Ppx/GppA family phosphatase, partial [Acidobacteriota bacterium]